MSSDRGRLRPLLAPDAKATWLAGGFQFTEGPTWSAFDQTLWFNDIPGDSRWKWSAANGIELVHRPTFKANGQAFDSDGSLVVCEHLSNSVVRIGPQGARETLAFQYQGRYLNSPNDVAIRSTDGSIYFTDPAYGRADNYTGLVRRRDLHFQGLFRIEAGRGEPELLVDEKEFVGPNGLCFSPEQDRLYVNDTERGEIKVWGVRADGSLSDGQVLVTGAAPNDHGWLDGMECDEHGNVWTSGPGGIWIVAPEGAVLGVIETPEPLGSLVWGGDELRTLFLASSTSIHSLQTRVAGCRLPGTYVGGDT